MERTAPEHPRALAADQERRAARPRRTRQQLAVARLEVAAVEVDLAVAQERANDREPLFEAIDPMVEWKAERPKLRLVPAGSKAEDQPSAGHFVHRCREFREHGGSVERGRRDKGPKPDPGRRRGDRRQERPDLPRPTG